MVLDPTLLKSFAYVVEYQGFTRAAERLGISQPSISQQMRRLEAEVGRPLLHREGQGIRLTSEGERLLPHALVVVRAVRNAEAHLREPALAGIIRLGVSIDIAGSQLPSVLKFFRDAAPGLRLHMETGLSPALSERLHRGEFDVVLGKRAEAATPGTVIWTDRLCWAVAEHHPEVAARRPLPLVALPRDSMTSEVAHAALRQAGVECHTVLESDCGLALRAGVLAGLGVAVFARRFMPPGIRCLESDEAALPVLPRVDFAFEVPRTPLPPYVQAFTSFLSSDAIEDAMIASESSE